MSCAVGAALFGGCGHAAAHTVEHAPTPGEVWSQWSFAPSITLPLAIGVAFYAVGTGRLWRRAGAGRGISIQSAAAYGAGILALIIALMSPLDAAGAALFSLHMIQHLLLILVAAPLIVIGAPEVALLWSLPARWRGGFGRFERWVGGGLSSDGGHPVGPLLITLLATGVLWIWHVPSLYDLAVQNEAVHYAEHAAFLITALLFWATVLRLRPRDHAGNGLRILYVFGMAVQGSILGALITLAAQPLYLSHTDIPPGWGLGALEDQQLAGLIMWVPPAALYIGVVAYLFTKWLDALDSRQDKRRARTMAPPRPAIEVTPETLAHSPSPPP